MGKKLVFENLDVRGNTELIRLTEKLFIPDLDWGLDEREQRIERACLEGKIVVINCDKMELTRNQDRIARNGIVPLRWGCPRILLVTPHQSKTLDAGDELIRIWKLWRYKFCPKTDAYVVGAPNKVQKLLEERIALGQLALEVQ